MKTLIIFAILFLFSIQLTAQVTVVTGPEENAYFSVGDTLVQIFEYPDMPGVFAGRTRDTVYALLTREYVEALLDANIQIRCAGFYIIAEQRIPIWAFPRRRYKNTLI